jgi:hypothetical protein
MLYSKETHVSPTFSRGEAIMLNGMEKANLVGTAATIAALVFPVVPPVGSVVVHFIFCLGIGSLITFFTVTQQPPRVAIQKVWWRFCQMVHQIIHLLAVGLNHLDRALYKSSKGRNHH